MSVNCVQHFDQVTQFCGGQYSDSGNSPLKVPGSSTKNQTKCPVWDSAMYNFKKQNLGVPGGSMQSKTCKNGKSTQPCTKDGDCSDGKCAYPFPDGTMGNFNAEFSQCYMISADRVKQWGGSDKLSIKSLAANWNTGIDPLQDNGNCILSKYGMFDTSGQRLGDSPLQIWTDKIAKLCTKKNGPLDKCYDGSKPNKQGFCGKQNSMLTDFNTYFSFDSDQGGSFGSVSLDYNCQNPSKSRFTGCKLPGWDHMASKENGRGWAVPKDGTCAVNPFQQCINKQCAYASKSGKRKACTNDSDCNLCDMSKKDKDGNGTCLMVPEQVCKTSDDCTDFTGAQAQADKIGVVSGSCKNSPGACCIARTTIGDTASNQVCTNCANMNQNLGMTSWTDGNVGVTIQSVSGTKDAIRLPYCGLKNGIAITPSNNSTGQAVDYTSFNDALECDTGGAFEGMCRGLVGCAGLTGAQGDIDNSCSHGLSNLGDVDERNPALNCPNVYTLSRTASAVLDDSCDMNPDYNFMDFTSMTLPEGAWAVGFTSAGQDDMSLGGGLCNPQNSQYQDNVPMVHTGCGKRRMTDDETKTIDKNAKYKGLENVCYDKDARWVVSGYATNYISTKGKLKSSNFDVALNSNKNTTFGAPQSKQARITYAQDSETNGCVCKFDKLNPVYIKDTTDPDEPGAFYEWEADENTGYHGWRFQFLPGYYTKDCQTNKGPCSE